MTQEQKAKAYDEAMNKIKPLYEQAKKDGNPIWSTYEYLIPELAESEDERIRRWLCDYFSSIDKAWIHKDITCIDILRWLEKQKEQKPVECIDFYNEFYKVYTGPKNILAYVNMFVKKLGYIPIDIHELSACVYYVIKHMEEDTKASQKEQKPSEFTHHKTNESLEDAVTHQMEDDGDVDDFVRRGIDDIALKYAELGAKWQKEQKPEWSEEDEKDMAHIIRILDDCYVYGTHDLSKTDRENLVNKLKSLRPSWKPSEDEERLINTSISFLKDFANKGYENAVECIDWLKSKLNGDSGK